MLNEDEIRSYADIIARAATDPVFFSTLAKNPASELAAAGIEVPADMNIHFVRNTLTEFYVVVPDASVLQDETLAAAAGGSTAGSAGSISTASTISSPGSIGCIGSAGSAGSAG